MNTLIVYNSSTGFTKMYSEELAKRTGGRAISLKDAHRGSIGHVDSLVFGSRAHAGSIERLRRGADLLLSSDAGKTAIFVTGAMPADAHAQINALWERNLPAAGLENTPHFYLPAGLRYETMQVWDRLLMRGLQFALRVKKNKTPEDFALEKSIAGSYDISDPAYLTSIVEWLTPGPSR